MYLKLAIRNVLRNRRRTLITELAIVLGVVAVIFVSSFLNGFGARWARSIVNSDSGHLTLVRGDYLEHLKAHSPKESLTDVGRLYGLLDVDPRVEASVAKLDIGGLVGTGDVSTTFFGVGLDLARQPAALPEAFNSVVEGQGLTTADRSGAVVGIGLAKSLNKKVGDAVLLATNTIDGQLNAIEVVIKGIIKTKQAEVDDSLVMISLTDAQRLLATPNRASRINVRLKPGVPLEAARLGLAPAVAAAEKSAEVKTWEVMNPKFADVNNLFRGITFIIGIVLFSIVAAGVANTMMMSVFERTREIGTIMAIGTGPRQVTWMFVLEGLVIGALGVILGLLLGVGLTLLTARTGIAFRPPDSTETYHIVPTLTALDSVAVAVLVTVMSVAASFLPAHLASKLDPIVALGRN